MTDSYTKFVLTGIAVCLVWLCAQGADIATPALAQSGTQNVRIVGVNIPLGGVGVGSSAIPVEVR